MIKFVFPILFLILSLDSFCQQNKIIISTKVILSIHGDIIKNNDSFMNPGAQKFTISLDSDTNQLIEAEYSILIGRGKANVYTMTGKGKEISLINFAPYIRPRDILLIEIKKLKTSTSGILKPSNGLFRIYMK